MPMSAPRPTRAEEVALFRLGIVGDLLNRDLQPGELGEELVNKARLSYRPPVSARSRRYHYKTIERWYYAAKKGFEHLKPRSRARGHGLVLDDAQRALLLDMRREHPTAPADIILAEAVRHGVLSEGAVSVETVRRLFRDAELSRQGLNRAARRQRRRWQASKVCEIWHGDVCHVWVRDLEGRPRKVYVHGILDDCCRYGVALEARQTEREVDQLSVLCGALLRFPAPAVYYVDNGSEYRGEVLALAGERLGIRVVHAEPYDPEARGKMERFWRTMRQRCTDHLPRGATLHDVNAALLAWLDEDYQRRPHAGLLGETPLRRFQEGLVGLPAPLGAEQLARALEVAVHPQVGKDATFRVNGCLFEVRGRHLAGRRIEVLVDPFTDEPIRASYQGQPVVFGPCDPMANARSGRPEPSDPRSSTTPFDPIAALLAAARKDPDHE
ncbi:MAG: integrase core domain-containing protein [Myxococcota bacterium]|nr:integrase core domain-containing protein [Myxococcota bacterium]